MAVVFDSSSASHAGNTGSKNETSFSWYHSPTNSPDGVAVFTFDNSENSNVTSVTYDGQQLKNIGTALNSTSTEKGDVKAWFKGSGVSAATQSPSDTWSANTNTNQLQSWVVYDVIYANSTWVAVANGSNIRYTTDPSGAGTWSKATGLSITNWIIRTIAYGNGYWVIAGNGGLLRYSTDVTSGPWLAPTTPPGFTSGETINSVIYANSTWVAVGSTGKMYYATDPTGTWTAASPGFGTNQIRQIVYSNSTWVAVGDNGTLRYASSITGTWSTPTSVGFGTESIYSVANNGSTTWVAVGTNGTVKYTTTLSGTWSTPSSSGFAAGDTIWTVKYLNSTWVAAGTSGKLRYTTTPSGTWSTPTDIVFGSTIVSLGFANNTWLFGAALGQIRYTSTIGGTWSVPTEVNLGVYQIYGLEFGNGYWVAACGYGKVYYSTDLFNWTLASTNFGTSDARCVTYENNTWVVAGQNGILQYTTDVTGTWSTPTSVGFGTNQIEDVAFGNGTWVAVGIGPTIRYTTTIGGTWSTPTSIGFTGTVVSVAYGNGTWVAGSLGDANGSTIRYTTTPSGTWSLPSNTNTAGYVFQVAYGSDGYWVAVGDPATGPRYTTTPSGTWSIATSSDTWGSYAWRDVQYSNGRWVACGYAGQLKYATIPSGTWFSPTSISANSYWNLAYGNGLWALGAGGGFITYYRSASLITVNRNNTSDEIFAAVVNVYSDTNTSTEVSDVGVEVGDIDIAVSDTTFDVIGDNFSTTNSLRFCGLNSGAPNIDLSLTSFSLQDQVISKIGQTPLYSNTNARDRNYLVSTTALSTTSSGTTISSGNTQSSTFVVAQTMVRTGLAANAFPSGSQNWYIYLSIASITGPYEMRFKLQRRNSSGTMQSESIYLPFYPESGGMLTDVLTSTGPYISYYASDLGTWAANDQLALVWEHRRPSGSGNKSATLNANGSSYIDPPNGRSGVIGLVRETNTGTGLRPIGFQLASVESNAVLYLAIRESLPNGWNII